MKRMDPSHSQRNYFIREMTGGFQPSGGQESLPVLKKPRKKPLSLSPGDCFYGVFITARPGEKGKILSVSFGFQFLDRDEPQRAGIDAVAFARRFGDAVDDEAGVGIRSAGGHV